MDVILAIEDGLGWRTIFYEVYDSGRLVWSWIREHTMSREAWVAMKRREEKDLEDL
jgi:hypothetical protein